MAPATRAFRRQAAPSQREATPVRLVDVSKSYQTRATPVRAVESFSLDCKPGEFVSLLGPSGCGKSTVLLMIAGLIPRTSGSITIGGAEVTRPQTDLGFVFQDSVLLDWR